MRQDKPYWGETGKFVQNEASADLSFNVVDVQRGSERISPNTSTPVQKTVGEELFKAMLSIDMQKSLYNLNGDPQRKSL